MDNNQASEILRATITTRKVRCFDYMEHLFKMSSIELQQAGYKTLEQALDSALRQALSDNRVLTNAFLKKYPD